MRPDAEDLQIHAWLDGEMDLESQLRFEDRLENQPALKAQVEALKGVSRSLREQAAYHRAPPDLRARIAAASGRVQEREPTRPKQRVSALLGQWLAWNPAVAALAFVALGAVVVNVPLLRMSETSALQEELVASHVRATLSQRAIDVASSDQHTVKPWFSTQLDFSPPVREIDVPGTVLVGGRVDYVQGRRVAVVVYQYRKHMVDHYMWPEAGGDTGVHATVVRGFNLAQWRQGGMTHRIVSDMNEQELQLIVQACRQAKG
jgi:anti-sigma factor RsiW